jgi:ubiquinone/menaquinone biosynthesis C-methylase UbiE
MGAREVISKSTCHPYTGGMTDEIVEHYSGSGYERERLSTRGGPLELLRTQALLQRFLPQPPATVLDIGGGPGVYAAWLADMGYDVHLVDYVPLHAQMARERLSGRAASPAGLTAAGDARHAPFKERVADAVLLLGPLYHLTERSDRLLALSEARRVARPGAPVLCAGISRFASLLDGLRVGLLGDPQFAEIVRQDLATGQHRNTTGKPWYFTTAYFHAPGELSAELADADIEVEGEFAIEGPGWLLGNLEETLADETERERLMTALAWTEREPSLIGASAHLLAAGRVT